MNEERNHRIPLGIADVNLAAHLFKPDRLTVARELRGLSKTELAERIQRTPSAISQFESGRIRPDGKTVGSLVLALGVPPAFLASPLAVSRLTVETCHFRSLRAASLKDRRKLLAAGTLLRELVSLLEDQLDLPTEQLSHLGQSVQSDDEIEECAEHVRAAWGLGLGPIPSPVRLLEGKGVFFSRVPESCGEVDAFSTWSDGRPFVFLAGDKESSSRSRFDAAHELGHLVMHADVEPGDQKTERQAHRFAGAFLIPREPFMAECPRRLNWDLLWELKRRWGTSVAAIAHRALDLRVFSDATYRRLFVQLNRYGFRQREPHEPPPEQPSLLRKSLDLIRDTTPIESLSTALNLSTVDVEALVAFST